MLDSRQRGSAMLTAILYFFGGAILLFYLRCKNSPFHFQREQPGIGEQVIVFILWPFVILMLWISSDT